jgi:aspartate kinase
MSVKVCKFGGTSVADAAQLRRVQAIVAADPARRFIITSAPGRRGPSDTKVTDLLYQCQSEVARGRSCAPSFELIAQRYRGIARELGLAFDLDAELAQVLLRIESGASADYAASRGEYLSARLLAEQLGLPFVDACELIRFDSEGRFSAQKTHELAAKRLSELPGAVIPGFYGTDDANQIVTFTRGGSDVSGAIIARAVNASVYENWTDVSGMLMADPRVVRDPAPIDEITYRELRELAYMGATVLHDEAIFPVRQAGIPVHILNTNAPSDRGTRIVAESALSSRRVGAITGIAGRQGFTIIAVEKTLMNAEVGFACRMLGVLERHRISFEHLPSGIDTMSLVVRSEWIAPKLEAVLEEIRTRCEPDTIEVQSNVALIATVGRGMMYTPGMAGRVFGALARAQINVRMIDQGSSELNIIAGVEDADFESAVRAIYAEFVPAG